MKRPLSAPRSAAAALFLAALVPQAFAQDHDMHDMGGMHEMPGLIWSSMSLESSGTSWQPASTPLPYPMIHIMSGGWMWMLHGNAYAIYDHAGGDRGGDKT